MLEDKEYKRAIKDLTKALYNGYPYDSLKYYVRGLIYTKLGQHEKAIEDYSRAIELNPSDFKKLDELERNPVDENV